MKTMIKHAIHISITSVIAQLQFEFMQSAVVKVKSIAVNKKNNIILSTINKSIFFAYILFDFITETDW